MATAFITIPVTILILTIGGFIADISDRIMW